MKIYVTSSWRNPHYFETIRIFSLNDHQVWDWRNPPTGRSAHLEAGWIAGRGKTVHILVLDDVEPDLMVLALNGKICSNYSELLNAITHS